ncbi:MAG: SIMPL domain-containing protein [Methanomicrobiaceae archaeon]|nr:SIMPL domain-containing protein [Methanomicrobiaceae archaeon]
MRGTPALLLAILLVAGAALTLPAMAVDEECDLHLLYVSGTGKITTDPDRAIVSLAVETQHSDVKSAQSENAIRMNGVINAVRALGIPSQDLKTTGYAISIIREDGEKSVFGREDTSYRVTNTLLVELKDIQKAGEVVDTAVKNGANRVNFVSFTLSDEKQESLRTEALTNAVNSARRDANAVAAAMGVSITGVKDVSVGSPVIPVRYAEIAYDAAPKAAGTPIEPNTIDVTATVSITYLIG